MAIDLKNLVTVMAAKMRVDPALAKAIVTIESGWNPNLSRYEPMWKYFYKVDLFASDLKITPATETVDQAKSYGLFQIMGGVARELGFNGYMQTLFQPETNISWGLMHLRNFTLKYNDIRDVIASYNAGSPRKTANGTTYSNQAYVDKVMENYHRFLNGEA